MQQVRERQKPYGITYVESKKYNKLVNLKIKKANRYRKQTSHYQWQEGGGGEIKA